LDELNQKAGIRLVLSDRTDPEGAGLNTHSMGIAGRVARYRPHVENPLAVEQISTKLSFKNILCRGVGFVPWRAAFYVAGEDGCLANFLTLLD
jgi:hypothetical protein